MRLQRVTVAFLLIFTFTAGVANAEVVRVAKRIRNPTTSTRDGGLILADRQVIRVLKQAADYIEQTKFAEAVELLQKVVELPEDTFFVPDPTKKSVFRSIKAEAQRLIGSLPDKGMEVYRLQFGADASGLLKVARQEGATELFAAVGRKYFHTAAGYEATYHLGVRHFDNGNAMAAALCFGRLRDMPRVADKWEPLLSLRTALCWHRLGLADKADEILSDVSRDHEHVAIAGREIPLLKRDGDADGWLTKNFGKSQRPIYRQGAEWTMYRGNPARNPVTTFDIDSVEKPWRALTNLDHRVPIPEDESLWPGNKVLATVYASQRRAVKTNKRHTLPGRFPLSIRGSILFRTLGRLRAVDSKTGNRQWGTIPDHLWYRLMPDTEETGIINPDPLLGHYMRQRVWDDGTSGRVCSDGAFAFIVENSGPIFSYEEDVNNTKKMRNPRKANQLRAVDLNTGGLIWGAGTELEVLNRQLLGLPLPGRYFLGPPLPMGGQVYSIVEQDRLIKLCVLDAATGALEWEQPMVPVSTDIASSPWRRLSGVTPAYDNGILVCPTSTGTIVAVDLLNRTLRWAYRSHLAALRVGQPIAPPVNVQGWVDDVPTIHGSRVLLTPRSSHELHCVNLLDGDLAWKRSREDGLYVAGIENGLVLVVGTNTVRAYQLKDGAPAWKKPIAIETPTGRALMTESQLFVPIGKQLAIIDTAKGELSRQVEIPGDYELGNLITAGGRLISQGGDCVMVVNIPPEIEPVK